MSNGIGNHGSGQLVCGRGQCCIFGMPRQKRIGLRLALMWFERAGGKYQHTTRFHPIRSTVQHRTLDRSQIVDRLQVDPLQHIRVSSHRACGAARCVEQNGVERLRWLPIHDIGIHTLRIQLRAFQIGHQPVHAPRAIVERSDRKTSRRQLHCFAAGCCTKIKRAFTSAIAQKPRRQAGGQILNPPSAFVIAVKFFDRRATRQTHMAGHQTYSAQPLGPCSGRGWLPQGQVQWRWFRQRLLRARNHLITPYRVPAHHHRLWQGRQFRQADFSAQQGSQHAMHQSPWAAVDQG